MRLNGKQEFKAINGKAKITSNRKTKIKLGNHQNGSNGYKTKRLAAVAAAAANDSDDSMVQIDFENVIPTRNVHQNGAIERTGNGNSTVTATECNGSPSLRQKVKYIPADHGFVHLKPPPINMEKIYVKQLPNGGVGGGGCGGNHQSYTLGVKNINTTDIPVIHNKLITVKQKESNDQMVAALTYISDEETSELTSNTTDDTDANIDNINIFDIPILFADNDGNILDDQNGDGNGTDNIDVINSTQHNQLESSKTIEIISEEIITDAIIGKFDFICTKICNSLFSSKKNI